MHESRGRGAMMPEHEHSILDGICCPLIRVVEPLVHISFPVVHRESTYQALLSSLTILSLSSYPGASRTSLQTWA